MRTYYLSMVYDDFHSYDYASVASRPAPSGEVQILEKRIPWSERMTENDHESINENYRVLVGNTLK